MKVCDLETVQELHELCKEKGIDMPESSFRWGRYAIIDERDPYSTRHVEVKWSEWSLYYVDDDLNIFYQLETIPAYTLDEVLEILPARIGDYWLHVDKVGAHYLNDKFKAIKSVLVNDKTNTTTAACKLAIWLIKEGYLTK